MKARKKIHKPAPNEAKKDRFSDPMRRVYQNFIGFTTLKDTASLACVSTTFAKETRKESTWRIRYETDVGRIFFRQDYKAQCQANIFSRDKVKFFGFDSYTFPKLIPHIEAYQNAPWAPYYRAFLDQFAHNGQRSAVPEQALAALEAGDLHCIGLLCVHFGEQLFNNWTIQLRDVMRFIELLIRARRENPDKDKIFQQAICSMHCIRYHVTSIDKENLKKIALDYFFALINMSDTDVYTFFPSLITSLFALGIFDGAAVNRLNKEEKAIAQLPNVLQVVMHPLIMDPMHLDEIARPMFTKFFRQLLQSSAAELQKMALQFCATKNWQKHLFKIIVMQVTATQENAPKLIQQTLASNADNIEKATPPVRCALTFVLLSQNNVIAAREQFDLAIAADHHAFDHYLQASFNFGVDQSKYRDPLNEFAQHEPVRKKRRLG